MTARRYAEGTDVPVSRSQADVRDMLRRVGVGRIALMDSPTGSAELWFEHQGRGYRLTVPVPKVDASKREREERRAWRVAVLLVKAKTEAIREGVSTVEREWFADTVMPDGQTLLEHARHQIDEAMATRGPLRLGFGGQQ